MQPGWKSSFELPRYEQRSISTQPCGKAGELLISRTAGFQTGGHQHKLLTLPADRGRYRLRQTGTLQFANQREVRCKTFMLAVEPETIRSQKIVQC